MSISAIAIKGHVAGESRQTLPFGLGIRTTPSFTFDRVPVILESDKIGLINNTLPPVVKYSVMEVRFGNLMKYMLRFGPFRSPHPGIVLKAIEEAKHIDLLLEVAEVPEPGVITRVGEDIHINDYMGNGTKGLAFKFLRAALPSQILIYPR